MTAAPRVLAEYGGYSVLRGQLSGESTPVAGALVEIQVHVDGQWVLVGSRVTSSEGRVEYPVRPRSAAAYRMRFGGDASRLVTTTPAVRVVPRAHLSTPKAPTAVRRGAYFTVSGALKPQHKAGTRAVRVYRWRRTSGTWKSYGYVSVPVTDHDGYSRYSTRMTLPSRGRWRLRVLHPSDSTHASSWSAPVEVRSVGEKLIALTFDDGPDTVGTQKVLDSLRRYNAKATFFLLGKYADRRPSLVRAIADDGHQLGNHRYTHGEPSTQLSTSAFRAEVVRTNEVIGEALESGPSAPITLRHPIAFRYPWGIGCSRTDEVVRSLDMRIWGWTYGPGDGGTHGPYAPFVRDLIARKALADARPNSVILLHDGQDRPNTVAAVPIILDELHDRGYDFVTVDELRRLR